MRLRGTLLLVGICLCGELIAQDGDRVPHDWRQRQASGKRLASRLATIEDDGDQSTNAHHDLVLQTAEYYASQRKWPLQLEYLRLARDKYRYQTWCGTCAEREHQAIQTSIEGCLLQLSRFDEVVDSCFTDLQLSGLNDRRAFRLADLYRQSGQSDDLKAILENLETSSSATETTKEIVKIHALEKAGDIEALVERLAHVSRVPLGVDNLDHADDENAVARAAAEALGRCGEHAYDAMQKQMAKDEHNRWFIYALGKCETPNAFHWLADHARRSSQTHDIRLAVFALSLHGEAGRKLLQQVADNDNVTVGRETRLRKEARSRLEQMADALFEKGYKPPIAGSLPKRWPLAPLEIVP